MPKMRRHRPARPVLDAPPPNVLRAAATRPEPSRLSIRAEGTVSIEAAKGEGKRPTFDIVGYTGAAMSIEGFFSPVIVDLTGLRAASTQIPALRSHDTDRIVGQTDAIAIGGDVRLSGTITGENEDAAEIVSQAKNGFRWQASIGATIVRREFLEGGKTATVNGRELVGPMVIAREAVLQEISFVAIGADNQTSADVAAAITLGTHNGSPEMNFAEWLKAKGIDPAAINDFTRDALRAKYDAEQSGAAGNQNTAVAATSAGTVAATSGSGARPDPAAVQSLETIFAEQRQETARVEEITRITAAARLDRPGMADALQRMSTTAIEAKVAPRDYELEVLRATRAPAGLGGFAVHRGDSKATAKTIEAALCIGGSLDNLEKRFDELTLNAAADRFPQGIGLNEAILIAARENGFTGQTHRDIKGMLEAAFPTQVRAQGWSTISLPNIFSAVANKFLAAGFNAVEDTWRSISARRNVPDFKAISTYALTGGFTFEKVGAGGELKHATVGELSYTNQVETYGRMFAITRKDLTNDDLGALTQVPKKLGRGGAMSLNRDFWTVFMNNGSFFTTGNLNYFEGAATNLSIASLTTAETTFRNQTDPDGDPVAIAPKILLVPNALAVTSATLMNSTMIAGDTTASTLTLASNPHAGKYQIAVSSYLSNSGITGNSTTAFYLLADPNDVAVIEVAFLNGKEAPTVESADADFNTLGIQFRGFFDYGVALQEKRAGVKSKGAA